MNKITDLIVYYPDNSIENYTIGENKIKNIYNLSGTSGSVFRIEFSTGKYAVFRNLGFKYYGTYDE